MVKTENPSSWLYDMVLVHRIDADGDTRSTEMCTTSQKERHISLAQLIITCGCPHRLSSPLFMKCSVGVDAARAFGTGCFETHRTHDLRGLSEAELAVGEMLSAECLT